MGPRPATSPLAGRSQATSIPDEGAAARRLPVRDGLSRGRADPPGPHVSGTTGAPIVNPYTAADVRQWREVMARSLVAAGVTAADVMLVTATFGLFTGGFGFQFGADALGTMVIPVGAGRTTLQPSSCEISGRPSLSDRDLSVADVIEVARQRVRLEVNDLRWACWARAVVRRAASADRDRDGNPNLRPHRHDGDRGPGMGIECHARDGIHVSGRPLPAGDRGSGDRSRSVGRRAG
jgi:hypothetical protein